MSDVGPKLQQAMAHYQAGRIEQARLALQRILQQHPGQPDACNGLSFILLRLGQVDQALYFAQRAAEARPNDAAVLLNLGNAYGVMGRSPDARAALERAVAANPELLQARQGLVNLMRDAGEYSAAAAQLEFCLARQPGNPTFTATYAAVLTNLARARESVEFARRAVAANPKDHTTASMLANAINYDEAATPEQVFDAHVAYGRSLSAALGPSAPPTLKNSRDPERPLRIGLLSYDLRRHSLAYFLEPLMANLDPSRIQVTAYATSATEDEISERLRSRTAAWRNVASTPDAALAERIRADQIDILIETCGLTRGHRLALMSRRAAPIQMTFLGYPNTTGVPAIDYRIVDSLTDPPGAERFCVEKPAHLDPCFLCYQPAPESEALSRPGSDDGSGADHAVTFASFNAAMKINDPLLRLWARILERIPGSRLILKAFDFRDAPLREQIAARFAAAGGDASRLEVLPPIDGADGHLGLYRRVDIALDTFPYNGTTTTCEALSMGVPVVSLAGQTHASRVGLTILSAVGLPDLVAPGPDQYVEIAARLASDAARRADLRSGLRSHLLASPLCDGPGYARRFETLLRSAWQSWCASNPSPALH